ncbi:MAG: hypothetical protein RLZZ385_346 [Pseudomonadota bacterium]|jgi:transcriptional regulator with XRE-family HTH domain
MQIDSRRVKALRNARQWSQEQLAMACGLNLRTIQRLESTGKASLESVHALASVFGVDSTELVLPSDDLPFSPMMAVKRGFTHYADFAGTASRAEYWWFFLFFVIVAAIAQVIHDKAYQIVVLVAALPLAAAGARRLNEAGESPWWQLLFIVPFGFVVPLSLLAKAPPQALHNSNTPEGSR